MTQKLMVHFIFESDDGAEGESIDWGPMALPLVPRVGDRILLPEGSEHRDFLVVHGVYYSLADDLESPIESGLGESKTQDGVGLIEVYLRNAERRLEVDE